MNNEEKLYNQALTKFSQGKYPQGVNDLIVASSSNYEPANKEIGLCYLHGIGIKQNVDKAINYFKKSHKNAESQFELSKLYYFGFGVTKNYQQSKDYLIQSVKQGHSPAITLMAMLYQIANKPKKCQKLLNYNLELNDRFSQHIKDKSLLKNKKSKLKFVNKFDYPKSFSLVEKVELNSKPEIFHAHTVLSAIECEYIKYVASPFMRESMTVDPSTGNYIRDNIRTSFSSSLDWLSEDPAINLIIGKCTAQFGVTQEQSEAMQVLHYSIGEEYKPHYDFFGGVENKENYSDSQQRIKTICLYLNNVDGGGQTVFPQLNIQVDPEKGKGIFFENINGDTHQPYLDSLHAGLPVTHGEKWLATLWIRAADTKRGPNHESV